MSLVYAKCHNMLYRGHFIWGNMSKMKRSAAGWVCSKCGFIANTYKEYNEHHKNNHGHTKCIYCGREFKQQCSCGEHEKYCEHNPTAKPSSRHKQSKSPLTHDMRTGHKYANRVCQFCGRDFTYEFSLHRHENACKMNPNRVPPKGHKWSELARVKLSKSMHTAALEGRNRGWATTRSGDNRMSYPETFFSKVISNEFADKSYTYNLPFYTWKLDFAWPAKKRVIEIDGNQHETKVQKESDERKDAKLIECGWSVLRIRWIDLYHKTDAFVKLAKEFIDNGQIIDVDPYVPKPRFKRYTKNMATAIRRINAPNFVSISEWNERRAIILNSGVDLHSFGWLEQVTRTTGLNRRVIYSTVRKFDMDVYVRKSPID